jgi:uncharacterized protein YbjT (DUF2867 family)
MAGAKTIAIVGATGAQGGGLARAVLAAEGPFRARALTRTPDSEAAQRLESMGAEVVQADLDDVSSLVRAFEGAHGAFCLTNFWEHMSADQEKAQAENLAEAARRAGVAHAIWSTFTDTRTYLPIDDDRMPVLQGRYNVPHYDAKGEAHGYFAERGVPTTFLATSFYWENFIVFGAGPKRGEDGGLVLAMPLGDAKLPGIAVEDIGRIALSVFERGDEYIGRTLGIAGEHLTGQQMARELAQALGVEVRYAAMSADAYRALGFPGADEMGNMYQFVRDFNDVYVAERNIDECRRLNPGLADFRSWLAENGKRIPLD